VYEAETGTVLWTADLPAGSVGIPAMYEIDGRQFFVVSATRPSEVGGGGSDADNQSTTSRAYVAFALP
jgi:quinoprotein glucose dehydrogenase